MRCCDLGPEGTDDGFEGLASSRESISILEDGSEDGLRPLDTPFCLSTSFWRFSKASFSRCAFDKNFGFDAAASASRFARTSSSTLNGCTLGFVAPHPFLAFFGAVRDGPFSSSGGPRGSDGGGGGTSSDGGGGTASTGGGGGLGGLRIVSTGGPGTSRSTAFTIELAIFLSTGALPKYEKSTNFTTCKFAENSQSRLRCQLSFVIRGYASAPRGYLRTK